MNLTAPFILTQVLLPHLRKSEDASVIFVSSGVVKQSRPFWGAYAVAKTGLESVRSMLAEELEGEANIRVNSVNPGRMRTALRAAAYPAEDPNTVPPPESVSGPFLYLLSERGRGIDGQLSTCNDDFGGTRMQLRTLYLHLAPCRSCVARRLSSALGAGDRPLEGDYVVRDFRFASGETLPELRLHYTTLGQAAARRARPRRPTRC